MSVVQGQTTPRLPARQLTIVVVLAAAFVALYAGVLRQLVDVWSTNYLYSYGFAVPLVSAYMVWSQWATLERTPWSPNYWRGIPLIVFGVALLIAGMLGSINAAQQLSLVVTLTGLCLTLFGVPIFKRVWFPALYLLLMLPIWDQPISRLQIPSQLLSARIAVAMLDAINVPVAREATQIMLPGLTLEVLKECSGVNQLIVVFAMALPAAYLFLTGNKRRILFVVSAVSIAYLSNGFRIALIGVLARHGYHEATRGTLHLLQGLIVSGVGYLLIGAVLSWLARGSSNDSHSSTTTEGAVRFAHRRPWLDAAVLTLLLVAAAYRVTFIPSPISLSADLRDLPVHLENWTLDSGALPSAADIRLTAPDDEIVRNYRNASGDRVRLYIGYYRRQEAGKELSHYAIESLDAGAQRLALDRRPGGRTEFIRNRGGDKGTLLFWFDVNGRIVDNLLAAKAYTIWDGLTRRRTNAAVVVVHWEPMTPRVDDASAEKSAMGFVRAVLPVLRRSFPS
jgi:EpsI family protein